MTRQMYASERTPDFDGARFDPIAEGRDYGLAPELLRTIWDRARAEASQGPGRLDVVRAQQRFHELAALAVARQRKTPAGDGGVGFDEIAATPGKQTLIDAQRRGDGRGAHGFDELMAPAPGKQTLIEAEAQRQGAPGPLTGQVSSPAEEMSDAERAAAPKATTGVPRRAVDASPE